MTKESIWEWAASSIAGTYGDPAEAADKLRLAAKHCRLIGGAAITPFVDGHEVMITVIPIDHADTYPIRQSRKEQEAGSPPRRGIGKATLMTIANAAGVEWLATKRVDDGSDPHYCVYHVEGRYRAIDGQYRPVVGDKDNDLRVGSDQIAGKSDFEVASLRATMMRSAITKAKLRALREAFGVPHGVLESEIEKPFVFAKTIFTGRSTDPATRRMFSQVIAMQQLAATAAMYGGSLPDMQLPAMQLRGAEEPKALPERTERTVVVTTNGEVLDDRKPAPSKPAAPPPVAAPPRGGNGNGRPAVWPWAPSKDGDPAKGTPLTNVDTASLERLVSYCEGKGAEGQYAAANAALAKAARAVIASRSQPQVVEAPAETDRGDDPENW